MRKPNEGDFEYHDEHWGKPRRGNSGAEPRDAHWNGPDRKSASITAVTPPAVLMNSRRFMKALPPG